MKNSILVAVMSIGLFGASALVETRDAAAQVSSSVGSVRGVMRAASASRRRRDRRRDLAGAAGRAGRHHRRRRPVLHHVAAARRLHADGLLQRRDVLARQRAHPGRQGSRRQRHGRHRRGDGKPKGEIIEHHGHGADRRSGLDQDRHHDHRRLHAQHPGRRARSAASLGAAAGSQGDSYGISFAGATSVENKYIVEGINTTDTGVRRAVVEPAERVHRGDRGHHRRLQRRVRPRDRRRRQRRHQAGLERVPRLGVRLLPARRVHRRREVDPARGRLDRYARPTSTTATTSAPSSAARSSRTSCGSTSASTRRSRSSTMTRLDPAPGRRGTATAMPGCRSEHGFTSTTGRSVGHPEHDFKTYFFTGKINGAINQNNQFQVSAFGNPRIARPRSTTCRRASRRRRAGHEYDDGAYDVSAKWTSKFDEGKTQIDAVVGYHRGYGDRSRASARRQVAERLLQLRRARSTTSHDLEGGAAIGGCDDDDAERSVPDDPELPGAAATPSQGLGFLENRVNARTLGGRVSLTQRVKAAGYHMFKAGVDVELATYNATNRYTGGARCSAFCEHSRPWRARVAGSCASSSSVVRNLTPDETALDPIGRRARDAARCSAPDDLAVCERAAMASPTPRTATSPRTSRTAGRFARTSRSTSACAGSSRSATSPRQLQGTITPEGETVRETATRSTTVGAAPRLHLRPDQEGKSKIFGHYGRFYENVPMDLNVRSFGGEIDNIDVVNVNRRHADAGGYDPNCNVDHTPGTTATDRRRRSTQCRDRPTRALLGGGTSYVVARPAGPVHRRDRSSAPSTSHAGPQGRRSTTSTARCRT